MNEKRTPSLRFILASLTVLSVLVTSGIFIWRYLVLDLGRNVPPGFQRFIIPAEVALTIAIFTGLATIYVYRYFVKKPLTQIHEMADYIIKGDITQRVRITHPAEFRALANKIGVMVDSIVHAQSEEDVDSLTGLFNFRHLTNYLETQVNLAARYSRPLTLAMLDIDHFGEINDLQGHEAGDAVLKLTAKYVESMVRQVDYVGRYGGKTFVIVLPETAAAPAMLVMEKIHREFTNHVFVGNDMKRSPVFASLGVADYPRSGQDAGNLIAAAKTALLVAKRRGRNQVAYFRSLGEGAA